MSKDEPQLRALGHSRDDILHNIGFFFGEPNSPERLRDYTEHHAMCALPPPTPPPNRRPHPYPTPPRPARLTSVFRGAGRFTFLVCWPTHPTATRVLRDTAPARTLVSTADRLCACAVADAYYGQNTSAPPPHVSE